MNRRFNSTGRVKISRETIDIRIVEHADGPPTFTADLSSLVTLGLAPEAKVIVEAYHRQSSMRFDFGAVASLVSPSDTTLTEIDRGEVVQFRVKVVDTLGRPGRLLAVAEQLRPADTDDDVERKPILPVYFVDLGEQIWRLRANSQEEPTLQLNSRIPDLGARLASDLYFRGAIFPAAIRDVLRILLTSEDLDSDAQWVEDWRLFTAALLDRDLPEDQQDEAEASQIIEDAVSAFCDREKSASSILSLETESGGDYE